MYIIHVIVVGAIALPLLAVTLPAMVKFLILMATAYVASNVIVSVYRSLVQAVKSSRQKSISRAVRLG